MSHTTPATFKTPARLKHKINLHCPAKISQVEKIAWDRKELRSLLEFVMHVLLDQACEVNIRFCDNEEMIDTNTRFRGKNKPTDVLSFCPSPEMQKSFTKLNFLGDILICLPYCMISAKKHKASVSQELTKMLVHGLVHLQGFDHERSEAAYNIMCALELAIAKEIKKQFGGQSFIDAAFTSGATNGNNKSQK